MLTCFFFLRVLRPPSSTLFPYTTLFRSSRLPMMFILWMVAMMVVIIPLFRSRSEERFSRNAETDLVCRLLLEKKKARSHQPDDQPDTHPDHDAGAPGPEALCWHW